MALILLFMKFKYSVYNRYIPAFDFENNDLANSHWLILIISEEEQIASMKCRLHAATVLRISANWINIHLSSIIDFILYGCSLCNFIELSQYNI